MTQELIIYHRKYPYPIWQRIDQYILGDSLPSGQGQPDSQFYSFNLAFYNPFFIDPLDNTFKPLKIANGDDIAIISDSTKTSVLDNIACGTVYQNNIKIIGFNADYGYYVTTSSLNIKQRDFSTRIFRLDKNSFTDNSSIQDLSTVLDFIFNDDNTKQDLGGVLSNGQVIPKYALLSNDISMQVFDIESTTIKVLTDVLKSIDYEWGIRYFSCPDTTNNIKIIQQVIIWQG